MSIKMSRQELVCAPAGPLPERFRSFVDNSGTLRAGDAYFPESDWTRSQIENDAGGVGCVSCGDEQAETVRGLCWWCG